MAQIGPQKLQRFIKKTAAKKGLTDLKIESLFTATVSNSQLLRRCLRSFIFGTVGYQTVNPDLFQQCEHEIHAILIKVFNVSNVECDTFMAEVKNETNSRDIKIRFYVIEAQGIEDFDETNVTFVFQTMEQNIAITQVLDNDNRIQSVGEEPKTVNIRAIHLAQLRASDKCIIIQLRIGEETHYDYNIPYNQITCEGFHEEITIQWTDKNNYFRKEKTYTVKLLIKLRFDMTGEESIKNSQIYHWYLIKSLFEYKLGLYRNPKKLFVPHFMSTKTPLKQKIPIKPINCREDLWRTSGRSVSDISEEIRETPKRDLVTGFLRTEGIIERKCKLSDFHCGDFFYGIDDQSVCLCNEWCNLEAFMHFNPIIRFILYQHNQLFVNNKTQIPIYYFVVFCKILRDNSAQQHATPVYNLLESIHTVVIEQIKRSFKDNNFNLKFYLDNPQTVGIIGAIYNCLRHDIGSELITSSRAIDSYVFSDTVIENIRIYYTVLYNLHQIIPSFSGFLNTNSSILLKEFEKELDKYSLIFYLTFLKENLRIILARTYRCPLESKLFNIDFTAQRKYDYESDIESVLEIRNRVNLIEKNPLNVMIYTNNSMTFVIKYSKFIEKILPFIEHKSVNDYKYQSNEYKNLDSDLNREISNFNFYVYYTAVDTRHSPINESYIYLYFTLMLYGVQFSIKVHNIHIIYRYSRLTPCPDVIPARDLEFIFKGDWIEFSFERMFHKRQNANVVQYITERNLYENGCQIPYQAIQNFYTTFWILCAHETQPSTSLLEASNSLILQHKRVYYFLNNNGYELNIFQNIRNQINKRIASIQERSEDILRNEILSVLSNMVWTENNVEKEFEAKPEVLDVLAFWLCRAEASVLINSVANVLKSLHDLENQQIVDQSTHFTLSKPGFVHIFGFMNLFLNRINEMKAFYMIYDDECDRISVVLDQTIISIKHLYNSSYRKFVYNWIAEVQHFSTDFTSRSPAEYTIISNAISLHIMNGYLFFYYIGLNHRHSFRFYRERLEKLLVRIRNSLQSRPSPPHHNAIQDLFDFHCIQYKNDINRLEQKTPFLSEPFNQLYAHVFQGFNVFTAQDLLPDLNVANAPII